MNAKQKHFFMAFALDTAILTLLVFYKFNFIFPDHNQFIFSGDFIRPITLESSIKYYVYPFVLNEHGTFVDPTFIVKIPYWSLVTLFSYIASLNLSYWLLIVVTQILSGLFISTSSRTLFSPEKKFSYYMIPLVPAIFAIFSYPINYRPYWLFLPLLPGLLQCVLIISYKTLINHKLSIRTKLLLVLIGYLAILQVHNIIFILIPLTSVFLVTALLEKKRLVIIKDYLLITFWLSFPFFLFMITTLMASFGGQLLSPPYVYSYNVLEFMSSKASFVNAFTFSIGFWEKVVYTNLDKLITLLIVSLVVMSYSLIKERKSFLLSIFLAFVISLSFQLGINSPIYKSLSDPSNQFAWILRDPFKISLVSLGLFTTIFTFTIKHLSINATPSKKILASFIMVLVILSVAVWSPATKTSKIIQPSTIPKEYFTAIDYLNENTDGSLLFLPIEGKRYTWAENPYLQGSFLAMSYQGNYIDYTVTSKEVKELLIYATSTKNLKALPLVTSGIVIDASIEGRSSCFDKMAHYILNNCTEHIVKLGDYLYFLPNEEYSRFRIVGDPLYLMTSTDYMYLGSFDEFLNMGQGVVFFDSFEWPLRNAEEIKLSSKVTNPSIAWSLGYTHEPLHGPWHSYLEKFGIENWQSDYGKGLVFTWAPTQLISSEINPLEGDISYRFNFENSINFTNLSPQFLNHSISEKAKEGKHSLQVEVVKGNTWDWKVISTDYLPIKPDNWYQYKIWISGKDVNGLHSKVIYYNETKGEIKADYIIGGQNGTFDWKEFSANFLSPSDARYIQIQFWVWQNNKTNSYYWIDDVRVYDLTKYTKLNDLKMNFQVKENGNYHLLIRYFENQKGESIKVILDDKEISLNSKDQLNKFVWKDLGEFYLEKGKHTIILRNIQGFNAVNLIAVVPSQEFLNIQKEIKVLLENKTVIYILEGESDIYNENANIEKTSQASNGKVLNILSNGKAWQELEVVKKGYYMFAFNLKGNFEVKIDNSTFLINSDSLNFTYIGPIYLEEGKHKIEVFPRSNLKPFIWNFSNENEANEWKQSTPENQFSSLYRVEWDKNENALKIELYNSTRGLKTIDSPLIPAKYGDKYKFEFFVKAENGESVHFKIFELNYSKQYVYGTYAEGIGDGTFGWKKIEYEYEPKNVSVSYLQLQIWHGHETKKTLPNVLWITNVTIYGYTKNYFDVIWAYSVNSSNSNITLESLFNVTEIPANVKNYSKINPTLWKVQVNATKPFMLSFAESYDPLWEARVYKDGKVVEKANSLPLYGVINGFWISTTGDNLEIVIRYKPQDWFEIGLVISGITFASCLFYLFYDWRRSKRDKWAIKLESKLKNIKFVRFLSFISYS